METKTKTIFVVIMLIMFVGSLSYMFYDKYGKDSTEENTISQQPSNDPNYQPEIASIAIQRYKAENKDGIQFEEIGYLGHLYTVAKFKGTISITHSPNCKCNTNNK